MCISYFRKEIFFFLVAIKRIISTFLDKIPVLKSCQVKGIGHQKKIKISHLFRSVYLFEDGSFRSLSV